MGRHKKKPNHQLPRWSELCPDLLRCVFKRLSFIDFDRAKFVCRGWFSTSKDCIPKPIPCVIMFPPNKETSDSSKKRKRKVVKKEKNRCVLIVPGDKVSVYKTRDLGVGFAKSFCLATYGSWLLMFNHPWEIYILNILTLERIDLPRPHSNYYPIAYKPSCLWIDDISKEYLVLWSVNSCKELLYTKNGDNSWRNIDPNPFKRSYQYIVYNHKDHKVYANSNDHIRVWDCSGDIPSKSVYLSFFDINITDTYDGNKSTTWRRFIAVTLSGQLLRVNCIRASEKEPWHFHIYKLDQEWVNIDSLGDEALILDIGHTVVANDITGIKRSSIYFFDRHCFGRTKYQILVYDLTTRTIETTRTFKQQSFPSCDRWFFPGLTS